MSAALVASLEKIARLAEGAGTPEEASRAIDEASAALRGASSAAGPSADKLKRLSEELGVWKQKISVIFAEPVGRRGMAKHARFWVEELAKP